MSGKLVTSRCCSPRRDEEHETDVIVFVGQMKMELGVRRPRAGRVRWVLDVDHVEDEDEDGGGAGGGVDVAEGALLVKLEEKDVGGGRVVNLKGKL